MTDDEEDQSTQQQPTRIDSLIMRIESNTGDEAVVLGSQSYNYLTTQEVDDAVEAINDNPKIQEVKVEATVSRNGAEKIVDGFLEGNVPQLDFDMFRTVFDPSQPRLMARQAQAERDVELYNEREERRTSELLTLFEPDYHASARMMGNQWKNFLLYQMMS